LAAAQTYPTKPVNVVVPFAAGGGVDAVARAVSARLERYLRQPVVIDNVAGAGGAIGSIKVARAPADGYTLLYGVSGNMTIAPLVAPAAARYDVFKDFTPLVSVAASPFVLIGSNNLPATSFSELVQLIKAKPGKLNLGTDGVGSTLHLTAELIMQKGGLKILHVPYKSGPQVLADLAGGQIDLAVIPVPLAQGFIREGRVRAYGVTSKDRWPTLPDTPSLAESAEWKGFEVLSWGGFFGPAGLSPEIVDVLVKGIREALADPDVAQKLDALSSRSMPLSGQHLKDYIASDRSMMSAIVDRAGLRSR
jgi:tripartite-type tricarboxylate transporter receptor subunit TctC